MGNFERVGSSNEHGLAPVTWDEIFSGNHTETQIKSYLEAAASNGVVGYVRLLLLGMGSHLDNMDGQEFVTQFGSYFINAIEGNSQKAIIAVILESGCNITSLGYVYESMSDLEIERVEAFFRNRDIKTDMRCRSIESILTRMKILRRAKKAGFSIVDGGNTNPAYPILEHLSIREKIRKSHMRIIK